MALYMAEMANTVDAEKVKSDFRDLLGTRSGLLEEFDMYTAA